MYIFLLKKNSFLHDADVGSAAIFYIPFLLFYAPQCSLVFFLYAASVELCDIIFFILACIYTTTGYYGGFWLRTL